MTSPAQSPARGPALAPVADVEVAEMVARLSEDDPRPITRLDCSRAATMLTRLARERQALWDRLEMNYAWQSKAGGPLERIAVDPGSRPDGIECRDETIKLLQAQVDRLSRERQAMRREALTEAAKASCEGCRLSWKLKGIRHGEPMPIHCQALSIRNLLNLPTPEGETP